MKNEKKIIFVTRYDSNGASSRQRFMVYFDLFKSFKHIYFFSNDQLKDRYSKGSYSLPMLLLSYLKFIILIPFYSILKYRFVVEKEIFPYFPYCVERLLLLGSKVVYDYDDAVYLNYDLSENILIKLFLKGKIKKIMRSSMGVIAGNRNIYEYSIDAGAVNVSYVPTVVEDLKYNSIAMQNINKINYPNSVVNIIWVGSPTTAKYLNNIIPILNNLACKYSITLTVVGASEKHLNATAEYLEINYIDWTPQSEIDSLRKADIGIMPLVDDVWERGKCGYKLIQYMACSIPAIGSPVGINSEILHGGEAGFLCENQVEWRSALVKLIGCNNMRREMGVAGYERFIKKYSLSANKESFIASIYSV